MREWWQNKRKARLREKIASLEAREQVWRITVINAKETNSYFVERWADVKGKIAETKARLQNLEGVTIAPSPKSTDNSTPLARRNQKKESGSSPEAGE